MDDAQREEIRISAKSATIRKNAPLTFSVRGVYSLPYRLWNLPAVLRFRSRLSRIIRSIQRSSHLRHAFKNAAGVALLSLPAFLASDSSGMFYLLLEAAVDDC